MAIKNTWIIIFGITDGSIYGEGFMEFIEGKLAMHFQENPNNNNG